MNDAKKTRNAVFSPSYDAASTWCFRTPELTVSNTALMFNGASSSRVD